MFGGRPRIPFEILLTPPAKLHEEDWKAYNVEQTSHLRRGYDMVKERDRVQRYKAARLYNFKQKKSYYSVQAASQSQALPSMDWSSSCSQKAI